MDIVDDEADQGPRQPDELPIQQLQDAIKRVELAAETLGARLSAPLEAERVRLAAQLAALRKRKLEAKPAHLRARDAERVVAKRAVALDKARAHRAALAEDMAAAEARLDEARASELEAQRALGAAREAASLVHAELAPTQPDASRPLADEVRDAIDKMRVVLNGFPAAIASGNTDIAFESAGGVLDEMLRHVGAGDEGAGAAAAAAPPPLRAAGLADAAAAGDPREDDRGARPPEGHIPAGAEEAVRGLRAEADEARAAAGAKSVEARG